MVRIEESIYKKRVLKLEQKVKNENNYVDIKWIGQAGFIFEHKNKTICIDPYLSDHPEIRIRSEPVPILPTEVRVDYVFVTHHHGDHTDEGSLLGICQASENAVFVGPPSCVKRMKKMGIPTERIKEVERSKPLIVDKIKVIPVLSDDDTEDGVGYIFDFDGIVIYNTGDSLFRTESSIQELTKIKNTYRPDILMIMMVESDKMGVHNIKKDVEVAKILEPKTVIPTHYGTLKRNTADPKDFASALRAAGVKTKLVVIDYNGVWRADPSSII